MKKLFLILAATLFVVVACNKQEVFPGSEDNTSIEFRNTPDPVIIPGANPGGNRTCNEVAAFFGCSFDFTSGKMDYDGGTGGTVGPITWTTDGTTVNWSSSVPVKVAFILKGGPAANVYFYGCSDDDCVTSGTGLVSPTNASGGPAGLSNLTICYSLCDQEAECNEETAWGGNSSGNGPAWWYYFDTQSGACQNIYAGQQLMSGGSVCYSGGVLTITLGEGWVLQNTEDEPVKIQGYNTIPGRRPAAGKFTTYKGDALTIAVGTGFRYYAIHLDVAYCE
jgi:hypothetical protein